MKTTPLSAGELDIKRRSRRRLIGALTLGLVAIVVLPMVFDSEPRKETANRQEIAIQIPPQDGQPPLPAPLPAPGSPLKPESAAGAVPAAPMPTASATKPTDGKTAAVEAPPAAPEKSAPAVSPAASAVTTPAPVPVSPAVKPTAERTPAKPSPSPATGGFVVQLGAYKDADNAKALSAKMKDARLPVVMDTVAIKSGKVTRVRVGPFADKAAAEAALAQVKLLGADGKIVPVKR